VFFRTAKFAKVAKALSKTLSVYLGVGKEALAFLAA
jgi:hypothetical protein